MFNLASIQTIIQRKPAGILFDDLLAFFVYLYGLILLLDHVDQGAAIVLFVNRSFFANEW